MTLLDSYIAVGDQHAPETHIERAEMYAAMSRGVRVTTSQASVFERHQQYGKVLSLYGRALYLCVGSAFTGNYGVVSGWKAAHDPEGRLAVVDTGAASGRLGLIALAAARYSLAAASESDVHAFAGRVVTACEEYIFLDSLKYLAAGGRMSRTGAFVGDLLRMKPVVTPAPDEARRVAVVRTAAEQEGLALEKMGASLDPAGRAIVMLEYTDNEERVRGIEGRVREMFPRAEVLVRPFSLTSGAHMGPGTWGAAFLPLGDGDDLPA